MTENNETEVISQGEAETEVITENAEGVEPETSDTENSGTEDSTIHIDMEAFDDSDILESLGEITEILDTMAADSALVNEQYLETLQVVSADIQQLNNNVVGASDRLLFLICLAICGAIWLIIRSVYKFFDMMF